MKKPLVMRAAYLGFIGTSVNKVPNVIHITNGLKGIFRWHFLESKWKPSEL